MLERNGIFLILGQRVRSEAKEETLHLRLLVPGIFAGHYEFWGAGVVFSRLIEIFARRDSTDCELRTVEIHFEIDETLLPVVTARCNTTRRYSVR
jgi:hypothetical protein